MNKLMLILQRGIEIYSNLAEDNTTRVQIVDFQMILYF